MVEEALMNIGLKEGVFFLLFLWLFFRQIKQSEERENKLYTFLDDMKNEFAKLVGSYEKLSKDVSDIREEIHEVKKSTKGNGE